MPGPAHHIKYNEKQNKVRFISITLAWLIATDKMIKQMIPFVFRDLLVARFVLEDETLEFLPKRILWTGEKDTQTICFLFAYLKNKFCCICNLSTILDGFYRILLVELKCDIRLFKRTK